MKPVFGKTFESVRARIADVGAVKYKSVALRIGFRQGAEAVVVLQGEGARVPFQAAGRAAPAQFGVETVSVPEVFVRFFVNISGYDVFKNNRPVRL